MLLNRRQFASSSLAAVALGGLAHRASAGPEAKCRVDSTGYGPLRADPAGLIDLPEGFTYQVISEFGQQMDDGFRVPDKFDGMGCFSLGGSRVALVRNHELSPRDMGSGPAGGDRALEDRLARTPAFGTDRNGLVLPGGTTTIIYDTRSGKTEGQYLSLAGTLVNCAGGITPWGSWMSCEETVLDSRDVGRDHGWVFEVPAAHRGAVNPVPLTDMGRFRHEAAVVDPRTGIAYLTEDREDGLFYRFIPNVPGQLAKGGRLQALAFADETLRPDSRNRATQDFAPGSSRTVRWLDLRDVHSPEDDLRVRGHRDGAVLFARGEGIIFGRDELYFTCTSGGPDGLGQILRYRPSVAEGRPAEGQAPGRLDLFLESRDSALFEYGDNLVIAPNGHLIVCEDRQNDQTNHLRGVLPDGRIYTLGRVRVNTEPAGVCFSPDGATMFVNLYRPGRTLAIRGPWHRFCA